MRLFRHSQVFLQSGKGLGGEALQVRVGPAVGLFLKLTDVFLVVLHHILNVSAIEFRAGETRELVFQRLIFGVVSVGKVMLSFCANDFN